MTNIINTSERLGDATFQSPEGLLRDILDNMIGKKGAFQDGKKLLVLCLDDTKGGYGVSWCQAGMTMSQCISLSDIAKQFFLREMEFTVFREDLDR